MLYEFQRQAVAVIAYVYMREIMGGKKLSQVHGTYDVTPEDGQKMYIDVIKLSRDQVEMQHHNYNWHIWSDMSDNGRIRIQTDDDEGKNRPFWIERANDYLVEGRDYDTRDISVRMPNSDYVEIEYGLKHRRRLYRVDSPNR